MSTTQQLRKQVNSLPTNWFNSSRHCFEFTNGTVNLPHLQLTFKVTLTRLVVTQEHDMAKMAMLNRVLSSGSPSNEFTINESYPASHIVYQRNAAVKT